jgi:hypothetical protein
LVEGRGDGRFKHAADADPEEHSAQLGDGINAELESRVVERRKYEVGDEGNVRGDCLCVVVERP